MENFIRENPVFACLLFFFALEQLAYIFLGSYPYRIGLRLRTDELPDAVSTKGSENLSVISGVKLKTSQNREEAYLRPTYPMLTWGPILFSCQIVTSKTSTVITRIGPASAVLVCYMFILSVVHDGVWGFLNGLCLVAFVAWLYITFRRKCLIFFDLVRNQE
jgi:hypothetical protein